MDNLLAMVEPVARQMCRLAYQNPDETMYVPRSMTLFRHDMLRYGRETFQGRNMLAAPMYGSQSANEFRFEQVRMPSITVPADDPSISVPLWQCYKAAAYDAILGSYAVKQVMLTGKDVPL